MSEEKIKEIFDTVFIANKFDGIFSSKDIIIEAMKELLKLYQEQKQLNEEHQKINGELRIKVKELEENLNNSISKDTIKELKEKLQNDLKYIGCENKDKPGDESCKKCFNSYRGANFVYCYAYHQIKLLNKILGE